MIIFDIDGVLADTKYKEKIFLRDKNIRNKRIKSKIDWTELFKDIKYDLPIQSGILIAKAIMNYIPQTEIMFLTARPQKYMKETLKWLSEHLQVNEDDIDITMRPNSYFKDSVLFKEQVGREIGFNNIDFVFEDDKYICNMWRKHNVNCYHALGGYL